MKGGRARRSGVGAREQARPVLGPELPMRDRADSGRAAGTTREEDRPWTTLRVGRHRPASRTLAHRGDRRARRAHALARIVNDRDTFLELLGDPDGAHVALEATYGWEWLAELLEEADYDVHLAHPLRTRAIAAASVEADAIDAKTLAHLLRAGFLPEAYVAPRELRDLRELLRHRATLDADALRGQEPGARDPGQSAGSPTERSTCSAKAAASSSSTLELRDAPRRRLDSLMSLICDFDREIEATTREIEERSEGRRPRRRADPDPRGRAVHRDADHRRGRRHQPLPDRAARLLLGRVGPQRAQQLTAKRAWAHHPPRISPRCAGRWSKPRRRSPPDPDRCAKKFERVGERRGRRSAKSRSPAKSSTCPATACATENSLPGAQQPREREEGWRTRHRPAARTSHRAGLRPRPRRDAHAQAS